jgi:hypothetical protein
VSYERRAARLALEAARSQGCVCAAEVVVTYAEPDVSMVVVNHDPWCPLLRVRREGTGRDGLQVVITPKDQGER